VRFDSTSRTVSEGQKHGGLTIPMIEVIVVDRDSVVPVEVGAHMLQVIRSRHLDDWEWRVSHIDRLAGTDELRTAVESGRVEELLASWREQARKFAADRAPYLLYE
jgi:uncharacterized protein YbbC (DUF1343 family)